MPPCPAPNTCWLYLIRHGATDNNRAKPPRLQGRRTDPGLSDEGLDQAKRTGRFLADVPMHAVYSSPLLRARQTAEAIAKPRQLTVEEVPGLIEVDVGDWEGRAWDEIQRDNPQAYRNFMTDAGIHPYLGGETVAAVLDRAGPALEKLMAENLGRAIAAVAHNVVNRTYLAQLVEIPVAKYRSIPQDNCGVSLLRYRNGKVQTVTINGVFHLE